MEHYKKRLIRCQTSDNFRLKPSNEPRHEGDQENEDVSESNGKITTAPDYAERQAMRQRKIAKKRAVCRNKFRHTNMELFKLGTGKPTSLCKTKQSYQQYTEKNQPSDHDKPKEPKEAITEFIISSIEGKERDFVRSKSTDYSNKTPGRHSLPQLVPEMPLKKTVRFSLSDADPRQTVVKRRKTVTGTESYRQPPAQSDTTSDCDSEPNLTTTAHSDDSSIDNHAPQNVTKPRSVRGNVTDSAKESRTYHPRNGGIHETVAPSVPHLDSCTPVQRSYRSRNGWAHETIEPADAGYPTNDEMRLLRPDNGLGPFPSVAHSERRKLRLKGHVDYKERLRLFFAQNRKPQTKPPSENEQQRNQPINLSVRQPSKPQAFVFPEITEQISRLGSDPDHRLVKATKNERKIDYLINYALDIATAAMTLPFSIGNLLIMNEKYRELQTYLTKTSVSTNAKLTLTTTMNKMVSYVCYKIFGDSTNMHLRWYTEQLLNSSLEHHRSELDSFILSFSYGGTKDESWFREFLGWIRFISRKAVDVPHDVPRVSTGVPHNQYKPYVDRERQFAVPSSNRQPLPYPNQQFLGASPASLAHFPSPPTASNPQQLSPAQFPMKIADTMPIAIPQCHITSPKDSSTQLPTSSKAMLPLFSVKIGDMRPCTDPQCQTLSPKLPTSNPPSDPIPPQFPAEIAQPEGQYPTSLNPLYSTVSAEMNVNPTMTSNPPLPIHSSYGQREVEVNCEDRERISEASVTIADGSDRKTRRVNEVIADHHVTKSVIVEDKSMEITKGGELLKERTTNDGEDEVILEKIEYPPGARNRVEKASGVRPAGTDPDDFDASPDFQLFKEILIEEDKDVYKKVLKKLMRVKEDTKRPAVILIDDEEDNSVEKTPIDLTKEKTQPFLIDLTNTTSKSTTGEKGEPPRKKTKKNKPFRIFKEILVIDDDETTKTMQRDDNQNCLEKIRCETKTFHPAIEDISSDTESLSNPQQTILDIAAEKIDSTSREIKRKNIATSPEKWDIESVPDEYEEARRNSIQPTTISERLNDRSPETARNVSTIKTLENGFLSGPPDVKSRRDTIISPKTVIEIDNGKTMAERGTKTTTLLELAGKTKRQHGTASEAEDTEIQEIDEAQQKDVPSTKADIEVCKHTATNLHPVRDEEEVAKNPPPSTDNNETEENNNVISIPSRVTNNDTMKPTNPAEKPRRKSIISPPITKSDTTKNHQADVTVDGLEAPKPPRTDNGVADPPTVLGRARPEPADAAPRRYSLISPPPTQTVSPHRAQRENGCAHRDQEKETVIVHSRPSGCHSRDVDSKEPAFSTPLGRQASRCASAGSKEDLRPRADTLTHQGYPSPSFCRSLSVPVVWNPWLSQPKGFPSSRRQSVETISNAGSDYSPNVAPGASTFEIRLDAKWYRISKNLYDKIPKGKLRWIKEKNSFVRYCDGNQMEQFVENTTEEGNTENLRRAKNPDGQSMYLGAVKSGEVIEMAHDVAFSSDPFVSEPETFSEEVSKVEKFIPLDFFGFYVYVTGFQIVNGNPPISFHTFLMMHNTNRTLMLLKKYIYNLLTTGEVDFSFNNQYANGLDQSA